MSCRKALGVLHVPAGADKGHGHPVHFLLHAKAQRRLVLLGQHRQVNGYAGQVDPLEGGDGAAVADASPDLEAVGFQHLQADDAVGNEDEVALPQVAQDARLREGNNRRVAGGLGRRNQVLLAVVEVLQPLLHVAEAQLDAAEVLQDGYRPAVLFGQPAHVVDDLFVFGKGAVGEVEPGAVHTGQNQLLQRLRGPGKPGRWWR